MLPFSDKLPLLYGASLLLLVACSTTPRQQGPGASGPESPALPRSYDQALVLMGSGDYTQAIPVLQKFIDKEPELAGPYLNLGIAYRNTGQLDAALEALHKAIELNSANPVAHHQIAIVQRELGAFEAALEAYTQALELAPDYALAHRNLGILYDLYLQQPAAALNHYRTYLELNPQPDNKVRDWVVDLERRVTGAQAKAEP
jgi:tetratricopeptide (TPR) repeat protein